MKSLKTKHFEHSAQPTMIIDNLSIKGEEGKSRHFTFMFIIKELIAVQDSLKHHFKVRFVTIILCFTRLLKVKLF